MQYPKVLTEDETLEAALAGKCIARYGDGELNLALGGTCIFQRPNAVLAGELRKILIRPRPNLVVCIPNIEAPTKLAWRNYGTPRYVSLYDQKMIYGSAFISRPDSAPWIDNESYWERLERLWRGKNVTLVAGTDVSLRPEQIDAKSLRIIRGPAEDAFSQIDRIDEQIGTPDGPVLLCLGPTATVLAWRLSRRKVQGLDLGHVGLYMRHRGAYAFKPEDLASFPYRDQIVTLHRQREWGQHGASHGPAVLAYASEIGATSVVDYGCGTGTLKKALPGIKTQLYDPGIPKFKALPKPADLVVATDVLEHIEPEKLDAVLRHIRLLAIKGAFLTISCTPARETLPDGRNAHLSLHDPQWWLKKLSDFGWVIARHELRKGVVVWLKI